MSDPIHVTLPGDAGSLRSLKAGTEVLLSGRVFTARDATHIRIVAELGETGRLPYDLAGETLFYAGPTPPAAGRPAGAVGPTTAARMDAWTPALLKAGIVATIGKGARGDSVRTACMMHGAVYLAAVGGAAALLATHVVGAETIAYPELGTEALVRLELDRLPVWVAIDVWGHDLYALARQSSAEEMSP
jgi:tartrate/fumarate subfamily iron-sulfur-dependent hydro-lyase beta chain